MPKVGLKYLVAAKYADTTGTAVYTSGAVIAKAMKVDIKWDKSDATLYADDALSECDFSLTGGTETLATDDLSYEAQALLLGHTLNTEKDELTVKDTDVAPYVGHGFYGKIKDGSTYKWRAVWFPKMVFSEPDDSYETQGEKTNFVTPTIEGKIMKSIDGSFKVETIVDSEASAKSWLDTKAGITSTPVGA